MIPVVIALVVVVLFFFLLSSHKEFSVSRVLVINLDRNTDRLEYVTKQYNNSGFKLPLERFPAIDGTLVDEKKHLSPVGLSELYEGEKNGRTRHHQLTRGALGCYLSHIQIFRWMKPGDVYLILEDDVVIQGPDFLKNAKKAPRDWDMILLGFNSCLGSSMNEAFVDVKSFWGTCGYLINHKGAQKFLAASGDRFDCQIDTFMSWMIQSSDFHVYALKNKTVYSGCEFKSDIQTDVKNIGIETYMYRDVLLQFDEEFF